MNENEIENRLMQYEARITVAEQKQKSHDDICAIRYSQITDTLREILTNQKDEKTKTANLERMSSFLVGGGKAFVAISIVLGIIVIMLRIAGSKAGL